MEFIIFLLSFLKIKFLTFFFVWLLIVELFRWWEVQITFMSLPNKNVQKEY